LKVRRFALTAALLAAAAGCGLGDQRPNVILISADTLRADHVGVNGYERDTTPTLDALAARGVNFTRAYSQAPNTAPGHTSILTSLYPTVHGVFRHGQIPDENLVSLPKALQQAGYDTAAFTQLNGDTFKPGFDTWHFIESATNIGKRLHDLEVVTDWIAERRAPWFTFVHSYDVHLPYAPGSEYIDLWAPDYQGGALERHQIMQEPINAINDGTLDVSERELQFIIDMYDAEIRRLDDIYAKFFADLAEMGVLDNTIIVLLSDHGEEFGEHGYWARHSYSLHEELYRVPLILAGPGIPEGATSDAPVRLVDAIWEGTETTLRQVIIERPGRRAVIHAGFKYTSTGLLFDLRSDPWGTVDIAEQNPEIAERLERDLHQWQARFVDMKDVVGTAGEVRLTEEERRRLRALGYLQ
jgi:arylsulfatase